MGETVFNHIARQQRIMELWRDGFVVLEGKRWALTPKGWGCLFACAEPAMRKPKPSGLPLREGKV